MPFFNQKRSVRQVTASSALVCGDIVQTADGYAGYVEAMRGIPNGETGHVSIEGIVEVTKASSSDVLAAGVRIQYNTTTKLASALNFGAPASGSIVIGTLARATASGATTLFVELNGNGPTLDLFGLVKNRRIRVATADVNAGLTLLPAIAGYRYRITGVSMIAIGGNASGATTVDILATQSASSVKLVANAVTGLTQSAILREGATNSTLLADGASHVANDANTAITISKTGSALATSTNIDVLLSYVVEPA
jgi:hypothetical protein